MTVCCVCNKILLHKRTGCICCAKDYCHEHYLDHLVATGAIQPHQNTEGLLQYFRDGEND